MSIKINFLLFILLTNLNCNINEQDSKNLIEQSVPKKIFGLYSYYYAMGEDADCESLKRTLRLNDDSTFAMKEYCEGNFMSRIKPLIKIGTWKKESDLYFKFTCSDSSTFNIMQVDDSTLQITPSTGDTYPYTRDTTIIEKI